MKPKQKQPEKKKKDSRIHEPVSLFCRLETYLGKHSRWIVIGTSFLAAILSLLFFNPDVSYGGDDSAYIFRAYDFINKTAFPSYQGPVYPIFLSPFVALFGINLILLKLLSVILFSLSTVLIYKLFAKFSNHTIATFTALATAMNLLLIKYASTTYNETFFIFLQTLFLLVVLNFISNSKSASNPVKSYWKPLALIVVLSYTLFQTKNVAIVNIPAVILILLLERQYLKSLLFTAGIGIVHVVFSLYKKIIWNAQALGFKDQLDGLWLKDFYKPDQGTEDLAGMIQRFWRNSELYLSKHLTKMTGFKPIYTTTPDTFTTIAIYVVVLLSAFYLLRKKSKLSNLFWYFGAMIGASFFMLQVNWDQERLVMIYFPLVIGFIAYALYLMFSSPRLKKVQWLPVCLGLVLLFSIAIQTVRSVEFDHFNDKFVSGKYSTYTPDWQNYMLASRWSGENLPDSAVVMCRKPQMSWMAANGRNIFNGIARLETTNPDSMVALYKNMGITHVIMGNLRVNPNMKTDRTISTIRNSLILLTQRYPACLTMLQEFGTDEKAYVFALNFSETIEEEQFYKNLDAAIIVYPDNLQLIGQKANYHFSRKEYDRCLEYLNFALHRHPEEVNFQYLKGLCYFQTSRFSEAADAFVAATKIKNDFNQAWYNAAVSYLYLGDFANAQSALNMARQTGYSGLTEQIEREIALNLRK